MRIGLLYPTRNAGEDDFLALAGRLRPSLDLAVHYFPWPSDIGDLTTLEVAKVLDAVRRLGSDAHLETALRDTEPFDAVAFAVTSSSFLTDPDHQLATLRRVTGAPATSTTAAFRDAIRFLGLDAVSLASVYHPSLSDHFVRRVQESGAAVVHRVDASAGSDRELAAWPPSQIVDLVARAAHPAAQAVLLPETALHTTGLTAALDRAAGCPVFTATQVTLWSAARLLGLAPVAADAGPLFAP
ncbi:aspartate racemase/maleate isomerase family protein [Amycolatopsis sp. NPDC004368]